MIFPQEKQPGAAAIASEGNTYSLSNELLAVDFVKENGTLVFGGCEALGLVAGSEVFSVQLANGTVIPASEFTLGEVKTEYLAADANAVKGSKRFAGVQLVAQFTNANGLAIEWRAVLRDGSHYIRTEMDIVNNGSDAINMYSITPMIYTVQNMDGEKVPAVVGNTRGAVIASDRIFAGLETPMGINTALGATDFDSFVYDSWTANDWAWNPGSETPAGVLSALNGLTNDGVVGKRGYLVFRQAGEMTVEFQYTRGSHRLNIVGVDIVDLNGNVVSSDYHYGYTGSAKDKNVYTVNVPQIGAYMIRYFAETKTETITSEGTITLDKKVVSPAIVYDLATTETPYYSPMTTEFVEVEEEETVEENFITDGTSISLTWSNGLPDFAKEENAPENLDTWKDTEATILVYSRKMQYTIDKGTLTMKFQFTGGSNTLDVVGVDILDANGAVVASDYHYGNAGTSTFVVEVPEKAEYTLRILVDSQGKVPYNTNGNITVTFEGAYEKLDLGCSLQGLWVASDWLAIDAAKVPQKVIDLGCTTANARVIEKDVCILTPGTMEVVLDYESGNHKLNIVGVDLLGVDGNVVVGDYHVGTTGDNNNNNTYSFDVEKSGVYTLRYIANNAEVINSTGNIDVNYSGNSNPVFTLYEDVVCKAGWIGGSWQDIDDASVPSRINEVGCTSENARVIERKIKIEATGELNITFDHTSGNTLSVVGVDLLDSNGGTVDSDYHLGTTGTADANNSYMLSVTPGTYTLRYFANNATEINSNGRIEMRLNVDYVVHLIAAKTTPIEGMWRRQTSLAVGDKWKISAVVGLIAPGQVRRSFLAYSERERAVPWRTFPHYNSWYELNINRNNAAPGQEHTNFTAEDILNVMEVWKEKYYNRFGEGIVAFIIDDGWDNYGPWTFHSGFPNEMRDMATLAKEMGAGIGAWLGPVGGYGQSGNYRRQYWSSKGGMQLSNPAYYEAYLAAANNLVCKQDGVEGFNPETDNYLFFKFDGISGQFSAVGPDAGATGEENAEGIIRLEQYVRENMREDIFFNTTVGTWASPFWYQISDATWRQENDHDRIGNNSINRENWITYRDRLVYQNYVQNSPICPINTLMTHGFILSEDGPPASDSRDYNAVLRELRCAFACGSGIVELYTNCNLLNTINDGKLWEDIAECVAWQKKNADVLPDAHWVGGNPWTGSRAEIYGWASWNGAKATLALRNGGNDAQSIKLTLREALDIPEYINTTVTLNHAFADQASIDGFAGIEMGTPINIDTELTITLPGSTIFVFDGADNSVVEVVKEKYYRFKDENGNYLAAGKTSLCVKAEADASTLFYLNENNALLSYSNGLYLNKTVGYEAVGHNGNAAVFKNGSEDGKVLVGVANGVFLGSDGANVNTAAGNWVIEEVDALPVTISSVGYATFYAPVEVSLPAEITAHTVTIDGDVAQLSDAIEIVPANEGVLLAGEAGTYNLAISATGVGAFEENILEGTIARTLVKKVEGDAYYILSQPEGEALGFYNPVAGSDDKVFYNGGHKSYLHIAGVAQSLGYRLGDGTTEIVEVGVEDGETIVYDIAGRRVSGKLLPGVYIVNGEKRVIK